MFKKDREFAFNEEYITVVERTVVQLHALNEVMPRIVAILITTTRRIKYVVGLVLGDSLRWLSSHLDRGYVTLRL